MTFRERISLADTINAMREVNSACAGLPTDHPARVCYVDAMNALDRAYHLLLEQAKVRRA